MAAGKKPAAHAAREALSAATRSRDVVLPLTAVHYFETWHRRDWRSRHALAGLMRDLSGFATFASMDRVLSGEVRRAVGRRLGVEVSAVEAVGWGVRHAFDHPLGRIRLIDPAHDDGGPGAEPDEAVRAALAQMTSAEFEFWSLAGPAADFDQMEFIDTAMRHRLGDGHVRDQAALAAHLAEHAPPGRFDDCVLAEWVHALWPYFMAVAEELDVNPRLAIGPPPRGLHWLVEDVPTAFTWCQLDQRLLRDRTYQWKQHDLNDMFALSMAAAYADVIVTERHWAHHLRGTSVVRSRGVRVLSSLHDALREIPA